MPDKGGPASGAAETATLTEVAYLHVRRGNESYAAGRKLKVLVDDQEVGAVSMNETVRLTVEPGDHLIHVKMDWVRSPPLTVTAAEGADVRIVAVLPEGQKGQWISMLRPSKGFGLRHE